jgi:hypothetical protein
MKTREEKLKELRRLIWEPEHTETICWCAPKFEKQGIQTLHIIHNEQRDTITKFVEENF